MKKEKGITLISLVITIILLLILAGVTINLTIGENGIFSTAQKAVERKNIAEYQEQIELIKTEVALENSGKITLEKLIEKLNANEIISEQEITQLNEEQIQLITEEGYIFIITSDTTEYIREEDATSVAKTNSTYYASVQDAINAVTTDNVQTTIVLLKDTSESISIPESKNIVLNLNNHTMNSTTGTIILNKGTVAITGGTITATVNNAIYNKGTVEIRESAEINGNSSSGSATLSNQSRSNSDYYRRQDNCNGCCYNW